MRDLGLEMRVGLHTGEIEPRRRRGPGIAVHIGARVASLAQRGEVLVTSTVKDLVAGSGLAFEDGGEHELKGVPDRWHLYRVIDQSGLVEGRAPRLDMGVSPPSQLDAMGPPSDSGWPLS
jgi:class 3 adenylate cyclase